MLQWPKKMSVVIITYHAKTVDIMTARILRSVGGVLGEEMERVNGDVEDLMDTVSPEAVHQAMYLRGGISVTKTFRMQGYHLP